MSVTTSIFHEDNDRDLERRVTAFLAGRSVPALRRLDVHSRQGVVTLRGHVQTYYEKQLSGNTARCVAGVVQLVDDVLVDTAASRDKLRFARSSAHEATLVGRAPGVADLFDLDLVSFAVKEDPLLTSA